MQLTVVEPQYWSFQEWQTSVTAPKLLHDVKRHASIKFTF